MRNYNLKQEVDWREVLNTMRWFVLLRENQLEYHICHHPVLIPFGREELEAALELYLDLRKFLRLTTVTKMEREARALLDSSRTEK